jgi:transposase
MKPFRVHSVREQPTHHKIMSKALLYVGLDVHADSITVAVAEPTRDGEIRLYGKISSDLHSLEKVLRKLGHPTKELHICYEAGPCGFVIARRCAQLKINCTVVAPSLTPKGKGDKVKTDRRDALMLARLHRAGELVAVHVPDANDEAIRDVCRARTDAVNDRKRARHQLKFFLLRNGYHYNESTSWSAKHMSYLRELALPTPAMKVVLEEYLLAVESGNERIERLEKHMATLMPDWHQAPVVKALMGFRGFQLVAAMITVSEISDIHRFDHPRQLMAYFGLVPSEDSSGTKKRVGSITKSGNSHARWLMNESAQHYRQPPKVSSALSKRQADIDKEHRAVVKKLSWKCQNRLYQKSQALAGRLKMRQKVQIALARELVGFVWALMKAVQPQAKAQAA